MQIHKKSIPLHSQSRNDSNDDSLAQQVEHNTFNVGVLGSSPKRITSRRESAMVLFFCFGICIGTVTSELIAVIGILITTENLTDALAHYLHITMVYELLSAEVRNEMSDFPCQSTMHVTQQYQSTIGKHAWSIEINTYFLVFVKERAAIRYGTPLMFFGN